MARDDQARAGGSGPLHGIRVLDLTDVLGSYAARLLADLGADVVRVEAPGTAATPHVAPYWQRRDQPAVSLFERFVNAGKRSVTLDLDAAESEPIVAQLVSSSDVLLESPASVLHEHGWDDQRVHAVNPALVRVFVTPYGRDATPTAGDASGDAAVDDLVLLGAGGLLYLGGYQDTGPVAVYGRQTTYMASIYAAVAAITGLIGRLNGGQGSYADVSAQECVAQALEESAVDYALTGQIRLPQGETAKEAGTGVYRCADGYVSMVAGRLGTSRAWSALVAWITSEAPEDAAGLLDERWSSFEFRQSNEAIKEFKNIFECFAASRTRQQLYEGAQARGIALAPVNDFAAVRADGQLASRHFFVDVDDPELETALTYPGLPYRMSGTPLGGPRPAPAPGGDNAAVFLDEFGLSDDEYECLMERGVV